MGNFPSTASTVIGNTLSRIYESNGWAIFLLLVIGLFSFGTCSTCIAPLAKEWNLASTIWSIIYHPLALLWALLWWKPIEWTLFILIGYYFVAQIDDYLSWGIDLYTHQFHYFIFLVLFTFKFFKVAVHFFAYFLYRPHTLPKDQKPRYTPFRDVTVIIPTVGEMERDAEFIECVENLIESRPAALIISTVGDAKLARARALIAEKQWGPAHGGIVTCLNGRIPNKRRQLMAGIARAKTDIIVFADDHVFWPSTFLSSILIPFEDPLVGHVGTVKRVRRSAKHAWHSAEDVLNYIASLYLERHNYECTASRAMDGGVFVISGRTACVRRSIFLDPAFQSAFTNEYWCGKGPMNVDDDNFITRWMVNAGYKTVFHNTPEARMETTLGEVGGYTKFFGQLKRWARTTVRSNTTTLLADRTVYHSQPWSVYAVYFSALVNFALVFDALLLYTYSKSGGSTTTMLISLLLSKLIKPLSVGYYWRNPADLRYLHIQILFAYIHSFIKFWCLVTARDISWGTRAGVDGAAAPSAPVEDDEGDGWDGDSRDIGVQMNSALLPTSLSPGRATLQRSIVNRTRNGAAERAESIETLRFLGSSPLAQGNPPPQRFQGLGIMMSGALGPPATAVQPQVIAGM